MPGIEFGFSLPTFVILPLLAGAWGWSWFSYRSTLPPVPRWKRLLLTALRGSALSLVLLLLAEPLVRLVVTSTQPPELAVLIDNSRSMGLTDRTGSRPDAAASVLADPGLARLADRAALRFSTFGTRLRDLAGGAPESLSFREEATDIAGALRALSETINSSNTRAVLLISDGGYTLGQNPLYDAERLGIPIFTVGIGDSAEQQDVLITSLLTNDLVYNDTEVPVDVTVRSSGFEGRRVEVTLLEGGKERARAPLLLEGGTREYRVRLPYVPEGEGTTRYTVRVSTLEGELTRENNRRSFFARVQKSRLRVLIVAGSPSPDLAIIRQTLAEQRHLEVRAITERLSGGLYEGGARASAFDSADCLLLIGFPTRATPAALLEAVRTAITGKGTPVLYLDGKTVDEERLRLLTPFLPFTAAGSGPLEQFVFFQASPAAQNHPVLRSGGIDAAAWDRLPPLYRRHGNFRAKPEATVLALARPGNLPATEPLILLRSVTNARSAAVLGYGLWRWRLMVQGNPDTGGLLASLLGNAIRWLTTRDDDRPVAVSPIADVFTSGDPASFTGRVRDASAQPVENAQLNLVARRDGGEYAAVLVSVGNGLYEGSIDGLPAGEYAFEAVATAAGQQLGRDRGRFAIGATDLEFVDTRMNVTVLRQLAARTGGRYYRSGTLGDLAVDIAALPSFVSRQVNSAAEKELWNWRATLGALVLLFGAEWFIRKRSGML